MKPISKNKTTSIIALLIVFTSFLVYYPGLNGPFIFDDFDNIVNNKNIHLQNLSLGSIQNAATSLTSGIFGRPIAAISFSLNYYLVDGKNNPFGFKLFNLIVHSINGLLVFWLTKFIFTCLKKHFPDTLRSISGHQHLIMLAASVALLWVTHPIQLTSVLYIVQRMTSMAATFILLALICYLYGRTALLEKRNIKGIFWLSGLPIFGVISVLCKESGLLLSLYLGMLELILFSHASPWNRWPSLSKQIRWGILIITGITFITLIISAIIYSIPSYTSRDFTLVERLLTETRVLIFYAGQVLIPRPSAFGLYHDGFTISHSVFSPWSTLPAIIIIISLLSYALVSRHKYPLLSLGILWFFISHALESTIYPFELVHEHRNYLASLGLIFVLIQCLIWIHNRYKNNKIWILIPIFIIPLSLTTFIRSSQWSNLYTLLQTQTRHNPDSPRAWMDLSNIQFKKQKHINAVASTRKAISLKPQEPAYSIYLHLYANLANIPLSADEKKNTLKSIRANPQSTKLSNLFHKINSCIETTCKDLQATMEVWLKTALEAFESSRYLYYLGSNLSAQGKLNEALHYLNQSIKTGPNHISPYVDKIEVLLKIGELNRAKKTYITLENISQKLYGRNTDQVLHIGQVISKYEAGL